MCTCTTVKERGASSDCPFSACRPQQTAEQVADAPGVEAADPAELVDNGLLVVAEDALHDLPAVISVDLVRLQAALALTLSIEPITIMHDVCHIDDDAEILAILRWAALAMLHTALDASPGAETD